VQNSNMRFKAFTYLEILVALALFSTGFIGFLQVIPLTNRYITQSGLTTQAAYAAQFVLENYREQSYDALLTTAGFTSVSGVQSTASLQPIVAAGTQVESSGPLSQFSYRLDFVPVNPNTGADMVSGSTYTDTYGFARLTVQVTWYDQRAQRTYSLSTYVRDRS